MERVMLNSPSDLAGAHVGPDAVAVLAGLPIVVADGQGTGIAWIAELGVFRFGPAGEADDVGVVVAEVAVGLLQGERVHLANEDKIRFFLSFLWEK